MMTPTFLTAQADKITLSRMKLADSLVAVLGFIHTLGARDGQARLRKVQRTIRLAATVAAVMLCAAGARGQQPTPTINGQAIGVSSTTTVTVYSKTAGIVSTVEVLTQGAKTAEFVDNGGLCTT